MNEYLIFCRDFAAEIYKVYVTFLLSTCAKFCPKFWWNVRDFNMILKQSSFKLYQFPPSTCRSIFKYKIIFLNPVFCILTNVQLINKVWLIGQEMWVHDWTTISVIKINNELVNLLLHILYRYSKWIGDWFLSFFVNLITVTLSHIRNIYFYLSN